MRPQPSGEAPPPRGGQGAGPCAERRPFVLSLGRHFIQRSLVPVLQKLIFNFLAGMWRRFVNLFFEVVAF